MNYKIVGATASLGQIEVAYFEGEKQYGVYAIDVPVVEGAFLTGDALHAEIMHRAPTWAPERERSVAAAVGFDKIQSLVQAFEPNGSVAPLSLEEQANRAMWEEAEFEQRVAKVLTKLKVLSENPTEIKVAKL